MTMSVHTQIHSQHRVFDTSGQLPFSIVFGFCRHSSSDAEPRPLILDISGSILDVPYALAHGLLTLHERDPKDSHHYIDVDLSRLSKITACHAEYLSLPSPIDRKAHWKESFVTYRHHVAPDSELASILVPGKKYTIRVASKDLGVNWWAYGDGGSDRLSEPAKLVNSQSTASNASFTVVKDLPWPPPVETRLRLSSSAPPRLEVSVTNTGSRAVSAQSRNNQSFLVPWGHDNPLSETLNDSSLRIFDPDPYRPPTASIKVSDASTGHAVNKSHQLGHASGTPGPHRPKVDWLVLLEPGVPVVRDLEIEHLVKGLEDGLYLIKMEERGCWWCERGMGADEDGRVPAKMYGTMIPPLMLESDDIVEFRIQDGKLIAR